MPWKDKEKNLQYTRDWRKRNKERIHKYNREIRTERLRKARYELKLFSVNVLGGKCKKCSYNKNYSALEFHHKEGSKKENEISKLIHQFSKTKLIKELKKCELLCSNCHHEEHFPNFDKSYQIASKINKFATNSTK